MAPRGGGALHAHETPPTPGRTSPTHHPPPPAQVDPCPFDAPHDPTHCPFAHAGEKAARRDPRLVPYSGTPCADYRRGACARGDACPHAHGVFETWLHPSRYRTLPCKHGAACARAVCFFAHSDAELRTAEEGGDRVVLPPPRKGARAAVGAAPGAPSHRAPSPNAPPLPPPSSSDEDDGRAASAPASPPGGSTPHPLRRHSLCNGDAVAMPGRARGRRGARGSGSTSAGSGGHPGTRHASAAAMAGALAALERAREQEAVLMALRVEAVRAAAAAAAAVAVPPRAVAPRPRHHHQQPWSSADQASSVAALMARLEVGQASVPPLAPPPPAWLPPAAPQPPPMLPTRRYAPPSQVPAIADAGFDAGWVDRLAAAAGGAAAQRLF